MAVLVVFAFAGIVRMTHLPSHLREATHRAHGTYSIVSDRSLTDDQKERRLREATIPLVVLFGRIVAGSILALALPLAAVWAMDRFGFISLPDVLGVLVRIDFLVAVSAFGVLTAWWMRRRGG